MFAPIEIDSVGPFTINIVNDADPLNPWTDWDCESPILVAHSRYSGYGVTSYGIDDALPDLSDEFVRKHWRFVLKTLNESTNWRDLLNFARTECNGPGELIDALRDAMNEFYEGSYKREQLELIADCYRLQGIQALVKPVRGPCQGDYALVLAAATPEWAERVGAAADTHEQQLSRAIQLYEDYAFGNVYGFQVENSEGEIVDSCYGFYGDSGMAEAMSQGKDVAAGLLASREDVLEAQSVD